MTRQFFAYSTPQVALAAAIGATAAATISIAADADFELQEMTYAAEQAGLLVINWAGLVQINDSGAGVPINTIAGTGSQPYVLPGYPRLVRANSTLTVTFTNRVATASVVTLVLSGYKLTA
jgi:hypothetical protein